MMVRTVARLAVGLTVAMVAASSLRAEMFMLAWPEKGRVYGPFELTDGAKVEMERAFFGLSVTGDADAGTRKLSLKALKTGRVYGPIRTVDGEEVTIGKATLAFALIDVPSVPVAAEPEVAAAGEAEAGQNAAEEGGGGAEDAVVQGAGEPGDADVVEGEAVPAAAGEGKVAKGGGEGKLPVMWALVLVFIVLLALGHSISFVVDRFKNRCPECKGHVVQRIKPGGYIGSSGAPGAGWTWKWESEKVCLKCREIECYVEGCNQRATKAFQHSFSVGGGKASATIPNALFTCGDHAPSVQLYQTLYEIFKVFLCLGFLGLFLSVMMHWGKWAEIPGDWRFLAGVCGLVVSGILCFAYRRVSRNSGLVRKSQYVHRVVGDSGSEWEDKGFQL